MGLMVVLGLLVALGLVAVVRWGGLSLEVPWGEDRDQPQETSESLRRFFWYASVGVGAGVGAGVVMLGAGGRLAMRLLAVTAGLEAQGRITEAEEVVGKITLDGTVGFVAFFGIAVGTLGGLLYMAVRRWLPAGRWGGATFGVLLLVLVATRFEPLRPDNPDFGLVGPGWLAVLVFASVTIGYGTLVAAIAGRYSRWLLPLKKDVATMVRYVPAYVVWGPGLIVLAPPLVLGAGAAVLFDRTSGVHELLADRRTLIAGRFIGAVVAILALPGFVSGVTDILRSA